MKYIKFFFLLSLILLLSCKKVSDRLDAEKEKLLKESESLKVKIDSGLKKVDSMKKDIDTFTQKILIDSLKPGDTVLKKILDPLNK